MKVGLYFGSFNPIHNGHLILANYILNETDVKKVWFIISPQNPFKRSGSLLNEYDRLHLARLSLQDDPRIKALDIEFKLARPSYTASTLVYLQEKHPNQQFVIIMGSDSFQNIEKWKNYESIIRNYPIYVYKRKGFEIKNTYDANLKILEAPLIEISASQIRDYLKKGKSIRYLVPETVREEIESRRFFKKQNQKK